MPGATTENAIPYPLTSENNATVAAIQALAEFIDSRVYSAGDIKTSIRVTAEAGWALLNGQTLTGAQSSYPKLWAVAPTAWKSGSNLVLPNWNDGYVMRGSAETGGSALGASTGANTKTLSTAELASHTHGLSHSHTLTGSSNGAGAHGHAINHDHAAATSSGGGAHDHNLGAGSLMYYVLAGQAEGFLGSGSAGRSGGYAAHAGHTHDVDIPNFVGNTSGDPGNHPQQERRSELLHQDLLNSYNTLRGPPSATQHTGGPLC
jgi:microcystin-dependent protein